MINIQIVSDLHLEFTGDKKKFNILKPSAPYLALVGDICCVADVSDFQIFKNFILELLPQYEHIIMVSGNHEAYTTSRQPTKLQTIDACHAKIRAFFRETSKKLHYLQNNTLKIIKGKKLYYIIGTTLWSNIPKEQYANIQSSLSDYKHIYIEDNNKVRLIVPNDIVTMFKRNYLYIKSQLARAAIDGATAIVLTHHCPFIKPDFGKNKLDYGYYSDCSALFTKNVALWGYGHTHIKDDHQYKGVRFYSMPKGYPMQHTNFDRAKSVNVK